MGNDPHPQLACLTFEKFDLAWFETALGVGAPKRGKCEPIFEVEVQFIRALAGKVAEQIERPTEVKASLAGKVEHDPTVFHDGGSRFQVQFMIT